MLNNDEKVLKFCDDHPVLVITLAALLTLVMSINIE